MPWARIDDKFHSHPKMREVWHREPRAIGLHVFALSYCMDQGTEGWVPRAWVEDQVPSASARKKIVNALLRAKAWERANGGNYRIHDFLEWNPSNDDIAARREATRARVARHRRRRNAA